MAISAGTIWEVRQGGNSANGGGYDPTIASPGTDYSLQNGPQVTFDGATITATSNAAGLVLTITGYTVATTDKANILNITGGTGFTTGRYAITTVDTGANTWTVDRDCSSTVGPSGLTGRMGGACAGPEDLGVATQPGNIVYIGDEGTDYTSTTTRTIQDSGNASAHVIYCGYLVGGTRSVADVAEADMPVFTSATDGVAIFATNAVSHVVFRNIKVTHTATTRGNGWTNVTNQSSQLIWHNCIADGCLSGWFNTSSAGTSFSPATYSKCEAKNCTGTGAGTNGGFITSFTSTGQRFINCVSHDNAGSGFIYTGSGTFSGFYNCLAYDNTSDGFHCKSTTSAANIHIINCIADNNGANGAYFAFTSGGPGGESLFINNIFYSNTTAGTNCATSGVMSGNSPIVINNAYGANGTARTNFRTGEGDISLSADPFTNRGSDDYSLNSTAGGGAACRQVGYPSLFVGTSNYIDIGAAQAVVTAGGSTRVYGS